MGLIRNMNRAAKYSKIKESMENLDSLKAKHDDTPLGQVQKKYGREAIRDAFKREHCIHHKAYNAYADGKILKVARDNQEHLSHGCSSFDMFCDNVMQMKRAMAYKLISYSEICEILIGAGLSVPFNESIARPMTCLKHRPDLVVEAWKACLAWKKEGDYRNKFGDTINMRSIGAPVVKDCVENIKTSHPDWNVKPKKETKDELIKRLLAENATLKKEIAALKAQV